MSRVQRVGRDTRKFRDFYASGPVASSVSRALWPAHTWRCLATGKMAQSRRLLIISGFWWSTLHHTPLIYFFYTVSVAAFFAGGVTMALFVLHHWSMLLVLLTLWSITAVITIRHVVSYIHLRGKQRPGQKKTRRLSPSPLFAASRFPETPMPATPLIRVLETIDLSSTDVEHFLSLPSDPGFPSPPPSRAGQMQAMDVQTSE